MDGVKRQRNTRELDDDENQTKKSVSRRSSSIFEDLSNELIYEIFDYLDGCEIYQVFSMFNTRFQSLLTSSCFRFKLNLPFVSKSDFFHRCRQMVTPNLDRIVSIYSPNSMTTDAILSLFTIDSFIQLEALTLNGVESDHIGSLLTRLTSLPRLFCLSITCLDYFWDENLVYKSIFRLRTLNYCQLKFPTGGERIPLAYASNEQDQCQTLEHFIIDGACRLDQLSAILTYTPRLKFLSCRIQRGFECTDIEIPILAMNLTRVSLNFCHISCDEFELFLSKISHQLKILRVTTCDHVGFLRADWWERLILSYMPRLRIFDFLYRIFSDDPLDTLLDPLLLDRFKSPFWLERKWFFAHQEWLREGEDSSAILYSIRPYRRKSYELYQVENDDIDFKTVRDLTIGGCPRNSQRSFFFPNVTRLTLRESDIERNNRFFVNIDSIIRLAQINQLIIQDQRLSVPQLLELLQYAFNIHSLTLSQVPCLKKPTTKVALMFDRVSKNNKITNLIIEDDCTLEHVQFFVNLCPYLQYFEMSIYGTQLELILRFLLTNKSVHLFSLCLLNLPCNDEMNGIQILFDSEKLLHDYFIRQTNTGLYLWW